MRKSSVRSYKNFEQTNGQGKNFPEQPENIRNTDNKNHFPTLEELVFDLSSKVQNTNTTTLSAQSYWWESNPKQVYQSLLQIITASNEITRFEDLPIPNFKELGSVSKVKIIKNKLGIYNPSEFYIIVGDADYSFENSTWMNYFPAFENIMEAMNGFAILLNAYHRVKTETESGKLIPSVREFVVGQLVLVKVNVELYPTSLESGIEDVTTYRYQMRRGLVTRLHNAISEDLSVTYAYKVYLLDFGYSLECSYEFLAPLPKPFHSIAPLATKVSLHGISSISGFWSSHAISTFSKYVSSLVSEDCYATLLSHPQSPTNLELALSVSIDIVEKTGRKINITQYLIENSSGIQWNLFPARPRLMRGAQSEVTEGPSVIYQDAVIMTSCYLPLTYHPLPASAVKLDILTYLHVNRHKFTYVHGMKNFLVVKAPQVIVDLHSALSNTKPKDELLVQVYLPRKSKEERETFMQHLADEDQHRCRLFEKIKHAERAQGIFGYQQKYQQWNPDNLK